VFDQTAVGVIYKHFSGNKKSSALTDRTNEFILKKVNIHIIEMEDVLFHLNSAVMMPQKPSGKSSSDGTDLGDKEYEEVSGVKALALVFRQFEFNPNIRMLISGHTDTSGTAKFNFVLSGERANNILYLLNGEKEKWCEVCANRHKVEDYQQIMKYFNARLKKNCNPGKIDNKCGFRTNLATKNFFKEITPASVNALLKIIKDDSEKRWPNEAWKPVYDLYSEELQDALEITSGQLKGSRKKLRESTDDLLKSVACGASFPIEEKEKKNYRSQRNRRVEILIFDKDEVPELKCPVDTDKVHEEKDCPLWRKFYFIPFYIEPKDLHSVVYHIKFIYYDRIRKTQLSVPDGLKIKAYEDNQKLIPTETIFKNGIYYVKVVFVNKIIDPVRTEFYFEFETKDSWIFTKNDKTNPEIKIETSANINKLDFNHRQKYYDLPTKWSSRNYWTRYDGDVNKGKRFEDVFKNVKKFKPFGDEITAPDKPIIFSLDDIVLIDKDGRQNINDLMNTMPKDKKKNYNPLNLLNPGLCDLSDKSRYSLLYIKDEDLVVYNPDTDDPYFTNYEFTENLITDTPTDGQIRLIIFANDFYSVSDKRTAINDKFKAKNHILGCRAANINDPDILCIMKLLGQGASAPYRYFAKDTGHFDLVYLHNGCEISSVDDLKMRSFLLIYWSGFIKKKSGDLHVLNADINNFKKHGMTNAKERWESKGYTIEPKSLDDQEKGKVQIKPVFHFEVKKSDLGGKPKCTVDVKSRGGGWMGFYSSGINKRDYQQRDKHGRGTVTDYDEKGYMNFSWAHELGHATGKDDEYAYHKGQKYDAKENYFYQYYPGMPYHFDLNSMMVKNEAPRMKQLWFFINRINDASKNDNELKKVLNETQYKIVYRFTKSGRERTFNYFLEKTLSKDYRDIHSPFKLGETTFEAGRTARREVPAVPARGSKPAIPRIPPRPAVQGKGIASLFLYKMGEDELSWNIKINNRQMFFAFDGILVVFLKIAFKFSDFRKIDGAWQKWTDHGAPDKQTWIDSVKDKINTLNGRFYMQNDGTNADFKRTYIFFFPICLDLNKVAADAKIKKPTSPNADFSKAHYTIDVIYNNKADVPQPVNDNELMVGNSVSRHWVARYIFGQDAIWTGAISNYKGRDERPHSVGRNVVVRNIDHSAAVSYNADDFFFIREWLRHELVDNSFQLRGTAPATIIPHAPPPPL